MVDKSRIAHKEDDDLIPFEDVLKNWEEKRRGWAPMDVKWKNRKWYEKAWDWVWFHCFYPLKPSELRWKWTQLKSFFIRGRRGWAPMDVWNFDYYLSEVIRDGLIYLKKTTHGYPGSLKSPEEWEEILDKMIWTFDVAVKIQRSEWYLIREEECQPGEYEKFLIEYRELSEKYGNHVMTTSEIQKYDEGWKLFKEHYFSLWD